MNIPEFFLRLLQAKRLRKIFFAILLLCLPAAAQKDALEEAIQSARRQYAQDPRLAVFDVSYRETAAGTVVVRGEVDNPEAKASVLAAVRKVAKGKVLDSIVILPDTALGTAIFGIVTVSVGNIRAKPREREELTSQVLLGTVIRLLKKREGYYYVQMPDRYLGWLDRLSFFATDKAGADSWKSSSKVVVLDYFGIVREQPAATSAPVCDVVLGCVLKSSGARDGWTHVHLADGRHGFIQNKAIQDYEAWKSRCRPTGEDIETTAMKLMGMPYLWGGTSVKGMDCSGFTKTVYSLNGVELLRDASEQATMGIEVDAGKDFENLQKGDLIFFSRNAGEKGPLRITHVAIYLGKRIFIHSSGRVRIGSFDPASPYFEPSLLARYASARRLF
jgi:hypothetical protein